MTTAARWTGILLAAGRGQRFDASGNTSKLLQRLADGKTVAEHSAASMLAVLPEVLVVLRPGSDALAGQLAGLGCQLEYCPAADLGMASSLTHALRASAASAGWIIALADMPFIQSDTIRALLHALQAGADIAVPVCHGRRGNPVGFSRKHLPQLLVLSGDQGARRLLQTMAVTEVAVNDAGIFHDVDVQADLEAGRRPG